MAGLGVGVAVGRKAKEKTSNRTRRQKLIREAQGKRMSDVEIQALLKRSGY